MNVKDRYNGIQDFFKSAGDGSCLALCYIRAALGKDATPQMFFDALWKAAERNIVNVKKDCFVEDAISLMKVANPKKVYSVIKKDVSSISGIKLGAVRYSYNGYSHWVLVEDGKIVFNSLEDSQCVKYGTPKESRLITIGE